VKIFGRRELNFPAALRWLRKTHGVKRLLCEGGGELNAALFHAGLVDELHLTICPVVFGGRSAPTLATGPDVEHLAKATRLSLATMKKAGAELFLVFSRSQQ
jgi:riboflavin biosynthesis pyrimidine reductase